ncbi:ferrochelatase [Methylococcus sp. EFPC2]|uniref:ferrochelatase n=1 Tax=Methylococcus sp. EFPC2 TaxID=2812648 RepID=UPI001967AE82|nr:ferrochelatase [Methylococcus sp. EFPC2]QSA95573.1 ferrochelatase [Methylococcus sp. EFPC2]
MSAKNTKTGLLLVNLGTPDAPTAAAVRRYLAEFLGDPRVVEIPRPIWWLILHGFILRLRPRKAAHAYASIWTEQGSPLLVLTKALAEAVHAELGDDIPVELAMRYGRPAIRERLEGLKARGVNNIIVLPLYPQYAAATTASIFDAVSATFTRWRHIPSWSFFSDYHDEPAYIEAVADSIAAYWQEHGRAERLLMSFHGLPERSRALGDPYYDQCVRSAALIAARLGLGEGAWQLVFQSRFGPAAWLKPYCVDVLKSLPGEGVRSVDVVCPGFAVDCLETLEEIAIANREVFLEAGGSSYRYIPALNDSPGNARLIAGLTRSRS